MLIAAAPPQAPAPNGPLALGLGDFDDDALLLLLRSAGRAAQMPGWPRVSSQWRRVWRVFLARVNTLNMPAAAPADGMAAHVRRARSLVSALRDSNGLLASVRKLKLGPRHSLDVNALLRGAVRSARTRPGMYDDLPPPALVVLGMLIASNAALVTADVADGFELPVPEDLPNFRGSVAGVIRVSRILAQLQTSTIPRALYLNYRLRDDAGPVAIALLGECLKHDASLTRLSLEGNSIAIAGALVLGEVLKVNASLKMLDLRGNQIGDAGAIGLGKALELNASLTTLDLGYNQIGDAGAIGLGKALELKTSLTRLNLLDNTFGLEAAAALVVGAKSKGGQVKTLCGIKDGATSEGFPGLGDSGAVLLSYDLTVNASLTELWLDKNDKITDASNSAIRTAWLSRSGREESGLRVRHWYL